MEKTAMKEVAVLLEEIYRTASPLSQEHFERARAVMPGGVKGVYFYQPHPLTMARGEGCYLYDVDGRRFVDFANHHTAQILGHNHPAVVEAVQEQLARGIALGAPVGVETELAEEMCRRVASLERIRFCNSGTEATLHAIRLARGFSGRPFGRLLRPSDPVKLVALLLSDNMEMMTGSLIDFDQTVGGARP
jgi:glutamate-1-semialdehyde 2,1-aminomutase